MTVLLGNSGAPRWYLGPERSFQAYVDLQVEWGATSTEIVLHHGDFDERTARVHVLEPDWRSTIRAYRERGLAVQFHVSLDERFATARWRHERDELRGEYLPLLRLLTEVAEEQQRIALVLHGAADPSATPTENRDATVGLLDWLATEFSVQSLPVYAAIELGAAKSGRESAAARSRRSVSEIVECVGSERVGICWDVAHDIENAPNEDGWTLIPGEQFLRRVVHMHLHDIGDDGLAHYPLLIGKVPFAAQLEALANICPLPSLTMEIRWYCASRLGDPWTMLGESYAVVAHALRRIAALDDRASL
ncbi:MAG TPA: TIM barrel protein [Nitrolancea sp.]|nr:TIM barrel protein [Nitrolancea sp.]